MSNDPMDPDQSRRSVREQRDELFRLLVERVRDYAIFLLDTDGHVASWNSGAELLKGYRSDEILGQHISRFYTEEDRAAGRSQRLLIKARTEGRVEDEGWRVRKDGERFWADVIITALYDDEGELRGFAKVTRDLTERRRLEDELRRAQHDLEQRVAQRTTELQARNRELEEFHDVTVGRELRMIELERENERLRQELSRLKGSRG
jgi:PAS domain S-box-containing protein